MKKFILPIFSVAAVLASSILFAQVPDSWDIKASNRNPKVGETVVLEATNLDDDPQLQIEWATGGSDDGKWSKAGGTQGVFEPKKPGNVTIVCLLSGRQSARKTITLNVADNSLPLPGTSQAPSVALQPTTSSATQSAISANGPLSQRALASQVSESLPSDAKPIRDIVDPSLARVVISGVMDDAQLPDAVSWSGAQGCKFNTWCVVITYDIPKKKQNSMALAWQVVPQGKKLNFGEFPGADVSHLDIKSLRLYAKADEQFGVLPLVEFKTGGNIADEFVAKHPNTYVVSTGVRQLSSGWSEFCMDLSRVNPNALKDVVSPLTVAVSASDNPPAKLGLFIDGAHFSSRKCK